jgi:hypothetical protein
VPATLREIEGEQVAFTTVMRTSGDGDGKAEGWEGRPCVGVTNGAVWARIRNVVGKIIAVS